MSEFANPAATAAGPQADTYAASVIKALGDRDALEVLRKMPDTLAAIVRDVPSNLLGKREAPGKWSINEVIQHLSDSERNGSFRFRMVMAQDRPALPAYDQDLWAERLRYSASNVNDALDEFSALRRSNVRLFERASDSDLARIGMHSERGEESLGYMLKLYAGHDIVHLRQIERIRGAVGAA
jgi:DinB family protein